MHQKLSSDSQQARGITKSVGYFIAKDMMPLNVVYGKGFCHMLEKLNPRYQVPSRKTMTEKVLPAMYAEVKETKVLPAIQAAEYCALTTDCWTSRSNDSYIGLTVHFLTSDWHHQHFTLENRELPGSHTAEHLAETLREILSNWKIAESKVSCTTIDNAANIHKTLADVPEWPYLHCFAHTLNLCVQAGLDVPRIRHAISMCSRLVAHFRRSSKATYALEEKQRALSVSEHNLIQDVVTRWNSTFDMIERILEQQTPICAALVDLKRMDLLPRDEEFLLCEALVQVLQPFKHITETVCGEAYTTVSSIKLLLHHLLNVALVPKASDAAPVKKMKETMETNLRSRYSLPETDEFLRIACFLDPRFRSLPFLSISERHDVQKSIRIQVADLIADGQQQKPEEATTKAAEPPAKKKKSDSGQAVKSILAGIFQSSATRSDKCAEDQAEDEILQYIKEKPLELKGNPTAWWKENSSRFPNLAKLAKKYLCIPATSVPAERLFSTAGNIVTARRASLNQLYI